MSYTTSDQQKQFPGRNAPGHMEWDLPEDLHPPKTFIVLSLPTLAFIYYNRIKWCHVYEVI